MVYFSPIVINLIIIICNQVRTEDFRYVVAAPEVLCEKNGTIRGLQNNFTTIRIPETPELGLIHKFKVDFIRTGCKQNIQRYTLLAWKAVRDLQKLLENYEETIQEITIDNSMLIPGFQYNIIVQIFNATEKIKENRIILDYSGKLMGENSTKIRLKLLGTNQSYNFIDFLIAADYSICNNITQFSFKWRLHDANGALLKIFKGINSQLTIPPFTLDVDKNYQIFCELIDDKGDILAQNNWGFFIKSKGLSVEFPVKYLTVTRNYPLRFRAIIRNFDKGSNQAIQQFWSCFDTVTNKSCNFKYYQEEIEIEEGFQVPGEYRIDLRIRQDNQEAQNDFIVNVTNSLPFVEIEEITNPVNPLLGVKIRVKIYRLRSFCTLQWTLVVDENYDYFDLSSVPGNLGKLTNITVPHDLFLLELDEFVNDTIDEQYDLIIPPPLSDWSGLGGDKSYLFRLLITCPALLEDYDDDSENEPLLYESKTTTISADINIKTNQPPRVDEIGISPDTGEAFLTIFRVSCNRIRSNNGPIRYKFGYFYKNQEIIAMTLLETNTIEISLPYSENGVPIFIETCDIFGICHKTSGPKVKTTLPKTDILDREIQELSNLMENHENQRALSIAYTLITFYKMINDYGKLEKCRSLIHKKIKEQVDELLEFSDNNDWNYRKISQDLIQNINKFSYDLQIPENLLNKLLQLNDKIFDVDVYNSRYIRRNLLSYQNRDPDGDPPTNDGIKTYLQTYETVIFNTKSPEKIQEIRMDLLEKMENYLKILCSRLYEKGGIIRIELQTLILSVERFQRNAFNNYHTIPFESNSWKIFAKIKLNQQVNRRSMCLAKAILKNYLNSTDKVFMAKLLTTDSETINQTMDNVVILPFDGNQTGQPHCFVYRDQWNSDCKALQNTSIYIKCSCKYLGYFRVDYLETSTATTRLMLYKNSSQLFVSDTNSTNESTDSLNSVTITYIVSVASIIGVILLALLLHCICNDDDDDDDDDGYNEGNDLNKDFDYPKYALLNNDEDILTGSHI